jgi:hypothetical protein
MDLQFMLKELFFQVYFFTVHLNTLLGTQTLQRQMVECLVNNELERNVE